MLFSVVGGRVVDSSSAFSARVPPPALRLSAGGCASAAAGTCAHGRAARACARRAARALPQRRHMAPPLHHFLYPGSARTKTPAGDLFYRMCLYIPYEPTIESLWVALYDAGRARRATKSLMAPTESLSRSYCDANCIAKIKSGIILYGNDTFSQNRSKLCSRRDLGVMQCANSVQVEIMPCARAFRRTQSGPCPNT